MRIEFFVPGEPASKGSARAFVVGGRAIITNDNQRAKPWASLISQLAIEAMEGAAPTAAPVRIDVVFYLPRPKGHLRANGLVRPGAPAHVVTKPDGDKLERCAWDALTGVVFLDDSQVVEWSGSKRYADDNRVGMHLTVSTLAATVAATVQPSLMEHANG